MARSKTKFLAREGLASQLAGDVLARISRDEIVPGARLPTEAEIAVQYGVSRTVVREAMSRLRADGVVNARPGAGTFVSLSGAVGAFRLGPELPSLIDILELRMAFEVEAARLAAARRDADDLAEMRRCLEVMATDVSGATVGVEADVGFHRAIALASKNPLYGDFFDFINSHISREIRLAREKTARLSRSRASGLWLHAQNEHMALLAAIEAANPVKAATAARTHIRNSIARIGRGDAA